MYIEQRRLESKSLSYSGPAKRKKTLSRTLPPGIMSAIIFVVLRRVPYPLVGYAHFSRAQALVATFLCGVPIQDISRVAIWSSTDTFMRHYVLDIRTEASVGKAVSWLRF